MTLANAMQTLLYEALSGPTNLSGIRSAIHCLSLALERHIAITGTPSAELARDGINSALSESPRFQVQSLIDLQAVMASYHSYWTHETLAEDWHGFVDETRGLFLRIKPLTNADA